MPTNSGKITFTVKPSNNPEYEEDLETLASDSESISDNEPAPLDDLENVTPVIELPLTNDSKHASNTGENPTSNHTNALPQGRPQTSVKMAHTSPETPEQKRKALHLHTSLAQIRQPQPQKNKQPPNKEDHTPKAKVQKPKEDKQRDKQPQKDQQQKQRLATEATKSSPLLTQIKKLIQNTLKEYNKKPTRKNEYRLAEPQRNTLNITVNQGRENSGIVTVQETIPNIFTLSSTLDNLSLNFLANTFSNVIRATNYSNKIEITPPQKPSTEYITAIATLYLQIKKINQCIDEENTKNTEIHGKLQEEFNNSFLFRKSVKFWTGKDKIIPTPKRLHLKLAINKQKMGDNYDAFQKNFREAITAIRNSEKQKTNLNTPRQL